MTYTMFSLHLFSFICVLLSATATVSSENVNVTIPLNKTITLVDKELYGDFLIIKSNSTVQFTLTKPNTKVDYIIFQVHSHVRNVTLYNNTMKFGSYISGTNIGLYGLLNPSPDTYYVWNNNEINIKLYISVHGYQKYDPIPGGCNMESSIPISPFMKVKYSDAVVTVDTPPPQHPKDPKCHDTMVKTKVYQLYLAETNFNEDVYFDKLKSMMTLGKIKENGDEIPQTLKYGILRRLLSAYPGTGSIYVSVAYSTGNDSFYSVYVPTHTYACSIMDGCESLDDIASQFFCAILVFIGLFTCYFGHRFFKTEMFLAGMFCGIITTYIIIPMWTDLAHPALLGASVLSGIFFGAIWVLFWWFYGIPIAAVSLPTMHLGFLIAAIVYYRSPGIPSILSNDGSFWTLFIVIILLTSITMSTVTITFSYLSNIICCAVLGAYATVFAFDHYMGSNLKYIVINTVRRAVVENFNDAVLAPPFQWRDALTTLLWVMLATSGFLFQHYHNRGRPPFPPPPRSMSRTTQDTLAYGAIPREQRGRNGALPVSSVREATERTALLR